MKLNLEAKNKEEILILQDLEATVSTELANKINNGVQITHNGKTLINKKTMETFMEYASKEAKKLVTNNAHYACIEATTVYEWAIHYFEEESILGTLYNLDGTKYEEPKPKVVTPTVKPAVRGEPKEQQLSLFDIIDAQLDKPKEEPEQVVEIHNQVIDLETGEILEEPTIKDETLETLNTLFGGAL